MATAPDQHSHELQELNSNPPMQPPYLVSPASPLESSGTSPVEEDAPRTKDTPELDGLEQSLSDKAQYDTATREFLHDYSQFKKSRAGSMFPSLVQLYIIQPSLTTPVLNPLDALKVDTSFSTALGLLSDSLGSANNEALRLCILSSHMSAELQSKMYPFKAELLASVERLRKKFEAPKLAILHTIEKEWQVSESVMKSCLLPRGFRLKVPVKLSVHGENQFLVGEPILLILITETSIRPFSLDNGDWISLSLRWFSHSPMYPGDVWIYIRQPHIQFPKLEIANFVIRAHGPVRNMLITFDLSRQSGITVKSLTLHKSLSGSHSNEIKIVLSIFSCFILLIKDTHMFLDTIWLEIDSMTLNGRRSPSTSKVNFVLHLDDCKRVSLIELAKAKALLAEISIYIVENSITLGVVDPTLSEQGERIENDIKELQRQLDEVGKDLVDLRTMIREQIDLRQIRLTATLTVLAAIYLPFSFISGMFGMNLRSNLWPTADHNTSSPANTTTSQIASAIVDRIQQFPNIPNLTVGAITPSSTMPGDTSAAASSTAANTGYLSFSQDQTAALIDAISNAGPYLWSFESFWYISVSLTAVTILLPIIAGPISRWTVRSFSHYKNYWRVLSLLLGLGVIVALSVTTTSTMYQWAVICPQGVLALWMLYRAWRTEKGKVIVSTYLTILVVCFELSLFVTRSLRSFPFTGIPPLYLFIVWIQEDILSFFAGPLGMIGQRFGRWKIRQTVRSHPTRWFLSSLLCLEGLNIGLALFCNTYSLYLVYMAAVGIPLGLYGIDKLSIAMREQRQRAVWMAYLMVVGATLYGDYVTGRVDMYTCDYSNAIDCEPILFCGWTALGSVFFLVIRHYRVEIWKFLRPKSGYLSSQPRLGASTDLESR